MSEEPVIPRVSRTGRTPLSAGQLRMWFWQEFSEGKALYNVAIALGLRGPLDAAALEACLRELLQRHEVLRSRWHVGEGEPWQSAEPVGEWRIDRLALEGVSPENSATEFQRIAREEASRPFDLTREPGMRATLVTIAAGEHRLLWTFHHSVCDGWSLAVLVEELRTLYEARISGTQVSLPELPLQFADFAAWERQWLDQGVRASDLDFWKKELADAPAALDLPTDHPRPATKSFRGASAPLEFSAAELQALQELARRNRSTLFMVLLAAWQTLMHRYSRQSTILCGSVIANRSHPDLKRVVGYFANTVALRADFTPGLTVGQLIHRARAATLNAYKHRQTPFEDVVEAIGAKRTAGRTPLIETMLVLDAPAVTNGKLGPLDMQELPAPLEVARFDLTLVLREQGDRLVGAIEYNVDLFEPATLARAAEHLHVLLTAMCRDDSQIIESLPWLTPEERNQLLVEWNTNSRPYPAHKTIHRLFDEQEARAPDAVAVVFDNQPLSYRDLNRRANALALHLRALGIGPNVPVGLYLERGPALIVAMLAALKAGGAYVPLDLDYPPERLAFMLAEAKCPLVIVESSSRSVFADSAVRVMSLADEPAWLARYANQTPPASSGAEDLAYVMYTSGSTGKPKGVEIPHRAVNALVAGMGDQFRLGPDAVIAQCSNSSFDPSTGEIWGALTTGAKLVIVPRNVLHTPELLAALIAEQRITGMLMVASLMHEYAQSKADAFGPLDTLMIGGESPRATALRRIIGSGSPPRRLINAYGPTETTLTAIAYEVPQMAPDAAWANAIAIGRPTANTQVYILDERGEPVPVGIIGEIHIGGAGLARGYRNQPELTAARFVPNPFGTPGSKLYRTGDLARYRADGNIEFAGRRDTQVKVLGFRVEPGEIEAVLNLCPGVAQSVVVARDHTQGDSRLAAYLVFTQPKNRPTAVELRQFVGRHLPAYMVPTAFVHLEALPLTVNGKVDRNALPDPQHATGDTSPVAPRSATEHAVWNIWREVLRFENAGVQDNFFELGGQSLLATQVISRIRHTLNVDLPLRALFEAPTIAELSERIDALDATENKLSQRPIEALSRDAPMPLSFSQQRMWFVQQLSPQGTAYNMPFALRVKGPLNTGALTAAVNALVARHEAFRTRFIVENGQPAQVIEATSSEPVRELDLRNLPVAQREAEAQRLFREDSMQPFDLSKGSLYRFLLARLDDNDHALLWLVHHAVGDQWSGGVLMAELGEFYRAFSQGATPELKPLTLQYGDYASWQREHLGGTALAGQIAYWRDKLKGVPALTLPVDHSRPPEQSFRGSYVFAPLTPELLSGLKRLSARQGCTPFMTLLACFKLLLARYCNQEDVAVGTPIANRTRIETENLVGTMVNTLVMRTSLAGYPTFNELLARVRETALGAFSNQDLPFERLVEELVDVRDMSHAPLVQVLFNVPNAPMRDIKLEGVDLDVFEFDSGSAQFDLSLSVSTERFQRVALSYSTELFDATTAERMLAHYLAILEQAIAEPNAPVATYKLLRGAEREQVVHEWNRSTADYPKARTDVLVARQAKRTPNAIAVSTATQRLTYSELEVRANRLARCLRARGVSRESTVGICLERTPDMVVALLAVMKAGGTYVPLDPAFPKARLEAMALDANLTLCITHSGVRDVLPAMPDKLLCLDLAQGEIKGQSAEPLAVEGSLDDLAYVLYTSGSTGKPKGVEISHRALTNLLWTMRATPGCGPKDVLLAVTTLSFDIAGLELYLPLIVGGQVALATSREASDGRLLLERMEQCEPTIMQATPATWRMLIESGWTHTDNLAVLCGGEPLPQDLAQKLLDRCSALWNVYGPTETTIWSMVERVHRDTDVTIGRPIANTAIYILDKNGEPVPVGVSGELYIGGDGVARGYRNLPEMTAERFVPDPFSTTPHQRIYRTGDLARALPDGRVVHLGRLDFQVKIRGYRIELSEIETALARHPDLAQVAVAAKDGPDGLKQLVAYLVPRGKNSPSPAALRDFLRSNLPEYMMPSQFVFMESFPLTANRKVDVKALPTPKAERSVATVAHVEPRGRLEVQLAVLWRQVLGNDAVGVHDNFFDMGGHSLKAVQLMSAIEEITGRDLPLATLFQAPTVAEMASLLTKAGWQPSWRSLVGIQPRGRRVPMFAVPGVGGNVLMFAQLSKLLGDNQPFYGLQARGLDDASEPFNSIPAMADHYASEIRNVRPKGPYVVIGTCTGGVIAYEVAHQLMRSGAAVVLILLETWHPSSAHTGGASVTTPWAVRFLSTKFLSFANALMRTPLRSWPAFLSSKARLMKRLMTVQVAETLVSSSYYSDRVVDATWHAISHYTPRPYPGKLLNVVASAREIAPGTADTRRMWEDLAEGGGKAMFLTAQDSGRMFISPHVEELAVRIKRHVTTEVESLGEKPQETQRLRKLVVAERSAAR